MLFDKMEQAEAVINEAMKSVDIADTNSKIISLMNELNEVVALQSEVAIKQRSLKTKNLSSNLELKLNNYLGIIKEIQAQLNDENIPTKNIIFDIKKDLRESNSKMDLIWQQYVNNSTRELYSSLEVTRNISSEKQKIDYTLRNINVLKTSKFMGDQSFMKIDSLIEEGSQAIQGLGLTKNVEDFLRKTMTGRATILDLSDEILAWIKKNHFEQLIKIGFLGN